MVRATGRPECSGTSDHRTKLSQHLTIASCWPRSPRCIRSTVRVSGLWLDRNSSSPTPSEGFAEALPVESNTQESPRRLATSYRKCELVNSGRGSERPEPVSASAQSGPLLITSRGGLVCTIVPACCRANRIACFCARAEFLVSGSGLCAVATISRIGIGLSPNNWEVGVRNDTAGSWMFHGPYPDG